MNAMAAHGAVTAQPQIVIVNDGQPVESVEHKRRGAKFAIYGGLVLVPLIFGSILGKIAAQNKAFNSAIGDAAKLRDDVNGLYKSVTAVQQTLQVARERGGGRFALNDEQLTKDLEALTLVEPSYALLSESQLTQLPSAATEGLLSFYRETQMLNLAIKDHLRKTKADQKVLQKGVQNTAAFLGQAGPSGYGGLVTIPAGGEGPSFVSVKLVQLGFPLCEDGKPQPKCSGTVTGYQQRADDSGAWVGSKLATPAGIGDQQVLVLDPDSKVLQSVVKGGEATVAEAAYSERVNAIRELVEGEAGDGGLLAVGKNLATMLQNVAGRGTKSTFFL
jgi:hypothetical protein